MTASTAQLSYTLRELRRAVADRFGDYLQLTTTANGAGGSDLNTLIDTLNVNAGAEHFNGRQIHIVSGDHAGHKARVTSTADSSGTLTFTPKAPGQIVSGVLVDVYNRRGTGFQIQEYDRAINNAIGDAFPLGLIDTIEAVSSGSITKNDYITTITVDAKFLEVYALEWQDDEDVWREIIKATKTNGYGWKARPDGVIELTGLPQDNSEENPLRIRGYARQDALTESAFTGTQTPTCGLPKEWVVARAAYYLALSAVMRGQEYGALAQQFAREAEMMRTRLRTIRRPSSERVRSF